MPTNTPNYNLVKPTGEEFYDVAVPNSNMDKIDIALKALADAISDGVTQQDLTAITNILTAHLDEMAKHNQFIDGGKKYQVILGWNPILDCPTMDYVEVVE